MSIFLRKIKAAAAVQLNSWPLISLCAFLSQSSLAQRPEPPVPTTPVPTQNVCELLSRGPGVDLTQQEATLHTLLSEFLASMSAGKFDELSKYFHSRAKGSKGIGDKVQAILKNRYDPPFQFTVYRVWRLRTPESGKAILADCPGSEGASLISQYGYEKQFAVWLQIMGQNELGRINLAIAPEKGRMAIIGFRIQQWTQGGSDWEAWAKQAQADQQKNDRIQAYFTFDVAQKLLQGEDFVLYPNQRLLKEARDKLYSQDELVKQLNAQIKSQSIAYIGSLLTKEGTGILIRETVNPNDSTHSLQELCVKRGRSLQELGWLKDNQGLRCNYIIAGMDPNQDSPLGGFYLSPADLKIPQK